MGDGSYGWAHMKVLVSGRGLAYAAAVETALKLEETCLRPVRGLSYADLKHGPIAIVDPQMVSKASPSRSGSIRTHPRSQQGHPDRLLRRHRRGDPTVSKEALGTRTSQLCFRFVPAVVGCLWGKCTEVVAGQAFSLVNGLQPWD